MSERLCYAVVIRQNKTTQQTESIKIPMDHTKLNIRPLTSKWFSWADKAGWTKDYEQQRRVTNKIGLITPVAGL